MNKIAFHLRITSILFVVMFILIAPASGWNTPSANSEGCCFSPACANQKPSEQCAFKAQLKDPYQDLHFYYQKWNAYSPSGHVYLTQNAIRIFHEEGWDNWAEYLAQESNFQAISDGETWADSYKGRWYLKLVLIWLGMEQELGSWNMNNYAGFDHCYSDFHENPNGQGLSDI